MRIKRLLVVLLAFVFISQTLALAQRRRSATTQRQSTAATTDSNVLPQIKFTEFRLDNGLRVILHEDHSTPIVAVNVWYHVGSKNEVPGRTGFAHLFEHMMFQGSLHHDDEYFQPIQQAGGAGNGSTNPDRTNYWEVVPSNFLEMALWLESDRMGYLLDALTDAKLANQRDVVKNEKRQNYDNRPYGLVGARIAEIMYPPNHPYHWLTIGSLDDITAASREDVSDFFRRFYTPNNATLSIAGDINPQQARAWVERYFGPLKRGPEVQRPNPQQPTLDHEVRVNMDERVALPRLYLTWHAVPFYTSNDAPLDMLSLVLAGNKGSRLYKSLVYDRQIAQDVVAFNNAREAAGQFQIVVTARQGHTLQELEEAVNAEIARIKTEPPTTEEMARAYNSIESSFIYSLQTVGGFGGIADQLNQYATFLNQPGYFQQDLMRYRNVTAADVSRVANEYLTDHRLVLTVTPKPRGRTAGEPAPAGPTQAIVPPSQQTAGQTASGTANAASTQTTRPPTATGTEASTQTTGSTAGVARPQTRTEAAATTPAGAAPPATTAVRSGPDRHAHQDQSQLGGLYVQPKPQTDPSFTLPRIQRRKLSNGLEVLLVEQHELPVVSMNLVLKTGAAADPQDRPGLASMTAAMLDEGTKTRSSLDISNQLASIGANLSAGADFDSTGVSLLTLKRHLPQALDIFTDVIKNPAFPDDELTRQRQQRLTALLQRRDNADAIAGVVYASLLYGSNHPYGHSAMGNELSVKAITGDDIRRFYETYYHPNNAALIVVGDVTAATLIPQLERAFNGWSSANVPAVNIAAPPERDAARIYLVDRPGAAQSVLNIGQIGVPRSSPDYFPLLVMNTMLGGQFTSRVNLNLRESKGYTYGARTAFDFRRSAGPFAASAGVQTAVTSESITEFLRELRGIRGEIPVTPQELDFSKQSLIRGFPRGFETSEQIAGRLSAIVLYGLPDSYFNNYMTNVRAVTLTDVQRVANKYLDPSRMAILVVGDRRVIESHLRSLPEIGQTITVLDTEGHPEGSNGEGGGGGTNR
ncbi:MAG TPA: insulinase family protein [Pyrinomonadaceae bacterium]|nr:insulinase family protein [Pyrinomonadaceae bacterium]